MLALGVSLGVHLAIALTPAPAAPRRAPEARRVDQASLVWVDVAPSLTPPQPLKLPSNSPPSPPIRRVAAVHTAKPQGATAAPEQAAPTSHPTQPDLPRAIDLLPGAGLVPVGDAAGAAKVVGRTLHPGDEPSEAEQRADEAARVGARVDRWVQGGLAHARAQNGLPDPAYGDLDRALRAATDEVPRFIDTNSPKEVLGALAQSWGAGAQRYGATGAAYDEPEGRLERIEKPSALAEATAKGSPDALALASFLSAGARLNEFADGRAGLELYALVEIRQQPSGALEQVTMTRPSGLAPFDAWVLDRAKTVAVSFSFDASARSKPLRSVWRFDGIILYRRKLKLSELDGRAALGMMTMAALSALSSLGNSTPTGPDSSRPMGPRMPAMTGHFDETTGALDVVDLTNPTYDCRVTLLEAD